MVMATKPSGMAAVMDKLGIDQSVLGTMTVPRSDLDTPDVAHVVAAHQVESGAVDDPVAKLEEANEQAEAEYLQAKKDLTNARSRYTRMKKKRDAAWNAYWEGDGTEAEYEKLDKQLQVREADRTAAEEALKAAEAKYAKTSADLLNAKRVKDDEAIATAYSDSVTLSDEERDAFLASLTQDQIEAISRYRTWQAAGDIDKALSVGGTPALADRDRDTSIYTPSTLPMLDGSEVKEVEGRLLDANTAIVRRSMGDFLVLYNTGNAYEVVANTSSKAQSLEVVEKIPVFNELEALPEGASEYEQQVWRAKQLAIVDAAKKAATSSGYGDNSKKVAEQALSTVTEDARAKMIDMTITGPIEADVAAGTSRHTKRLRELKADEAGKAARKEALANGATKKEAEAAYEKARKMALGTPTIGGGTIPHFDHKIPPESLGEAGYASLTRSGIRAWGVETADDYSVIKARSGNLSAWGFGNGAHVQTSDINELNARAKPFLKSLTAKERDALTTYTGGSYQDINAAITGRNPNPTSGVKTTVSRIESAFDKLKQADKNPEPMTVLRGTRVPSGWKGTADEYLEKAFKPGSRMEIGKVTSCTTNAGTANGFSHGFIMAIRSRSGLSVKTISNFSSEDEVILPMGTQLRCVEVKKQGIGGAPTVYLVEEDLVAEAQDSAVAKAA